MKISFFGAGAIGSMLGALVQQVAPEHEVLLVVRGEHGHQIAERGGVELVGPWGSRLIRVQSTFDGAGIAGSDIVFVTVKSQDTLKALETIESHLEDAAVVSLQNGINDRAFLSRLPANRIVMGMTATNMAIPSPGTVSLQLDGPSVFGPVAGTPLTYSVKRVVDLLNRIQVPGLTFHADANVAGVRYNKLSLNVLGYTSCLSASNFITEALCHRPWRDVVGRPLVAECRRVFDAAGIELAPIPGRSDLSRVEGLMQKLDVPLLGPMIRFGARRIYDRKPIVFSLLQDLQKGKKTEVDYINGEIVRLAREHGTTAPLNAQVVQMVHELEERGDGSFYSRDEVIARFAHVAPPRPAGSDLTPTASLSSTTPL